MITISKPNLSRDRGKSRTNVDAVPSDFKYGKKKATVHKTVQYWFNDVNYPNLFHFDFSMQDKGLFASFDDIWFNCPKGPDGECRKYDIVDDIMYKFSLKVERATKMQLRIQGSD